MTITHDNALSLYFSESVRKEDKKEGWKKRKKENKAGYTAQDAPITRLKIMRDERTYGRTYGLTDARTDTPSYRDATAHLKTI